MVKLKDKQIVWVSYLLVGLGLLYLAITQIKIGTFFSLDYGLFVLLGVLVAMFPIRTNDSVFSLGDGVSLAVFVIFGVLPELFLSTVATIASLIRSDVKWDQHYRYPINLLMISILSFLSAGAYYGTYGVLNFFNLSFLRILPMVVYMFVHLIGNHILLYLAAKYFYKQETPTFVNDKLILSLKTKIYLLPLSYLLIFLYYEMNVFGIFAGALPIMLITIGGNNYHRTQSKNLYLTQVNQAAQKLTATMNREDVIQFFTQSLLNIFPSERIYYFRVVGKQQVVLDCIYHKDQTIETMNKEMVLQKNSSLSKALESHSIATYDKLREWLPLFTFDTTHHAESAMIIPVHIVTQNKGILLMTHSKQSIYDDYLTSLVEIFYQYFITVLDNATHYEKLEASNMTDYLTELPNFRGFSMKFDEMVESREFETLSIIILDLDYFKKVNDVHGHEAGNDVLRQVAEVLKSFEKEKRFIARYGGEEFILLLRDVEKEEVLELAEAIRQKIAQTPYKIHCSITAKQTAQVYVTASLGVASYPEDCDDIYDLMSLADRLMYLGSKQKGRNRVTAKNEEGSP